MCTKMDHHLSQITVLVDNLINVCHMCQHKREGWSRIGRLLIEMKDNVTNLNAFVITTVKKKIFAFVSAKL
jgi:hypothetical protein